MKII
ncbi:hypothetical protein CGLO_00146 [Colletotrichum gloeosporioides Cg-14]|jgi:nucleoside-diphosphate-sugar epimerase